MNERLKELAKLLTRLQFFQCELMFRSGFKMLTFDMLIFVSVANTSINQHNLVRALENIGPILLLEAKAFMAQNAGKVH